MDIEILQKRADIIKQVRTFFDSKGYLELDTPLLSPDLIPESCLEVFETKRIFPHGSKKESQSLYLIPSPEIYMKKIIAQHKVNVFQICKCFRNGESTGRLHNSEFTMLEYYTMNADYMDSLALTEELFRKTSHEDTKSQRTQRREEKGVSTFERITVAEAFKQHAGFDIFEAAAEGAEEMVIQARRLGLEPMQNMTVPQLYDLIFIHAVEPRLKSEKPVALIDYPAFVPCLARRKEPPAKLPAEQVTGNKEQLSETVERWELYWNGVEIANCYSEETDSEKVKKFFDNEEAEKKRSNVVQHKVDHDYYKMFEGGNFPRCSGVAIGLDRLIMALTGKMSIDVVMVTAN